MALKYAAATASPLVVAALAVAPSATAAPSFPGLGKYQAVDAAEYPAHYSYPSYPEAYSGVAFSTPAGQQCALTRNSRNMTLLAACDGPLPGVDQKSVSAFNNQAGAFQSYGTGDGPYNPLPAGSKIDFADSQMSASCVVDAAMTACVVVDNRPGVTPARHGFVLGPEESSTF